MRSKKIHDFITFILKPVFKSSINRFDEIEQEEMRMIDSIPLDLDIPDDSKVISVTIWLGSILDFNI